MKMRIITNTEWDRMADLTGGDNDLMHWENMFSYVDRTTNPRSASTRVIRGYRAARGWDGSNATHRNADSGFRPTITDLALDALHSGIKDGQIVTVGTLYMDGKPVRVPQNPTEKGDIEDYILGSTLEMREPLKDPAYQVTGIKDGDKVYVDRALLKNISYEDVEKAMRETTLMESASAGKDEVFATQNYPPYLVVNGQKVTFAELSAYMGISGDSIKVELCQDVPSGTIVAHGRNSTNEYPCLELELRTVLDVERPIVLARAEQPVIERNAPPTVFMYGNSEGSYICQMAVDTRPDEMRDSTTSLLVSGDPDNRIHIITANSYHTIEEQ